MSRRIFLRTLVAVVATVIGLLTLSGVLFAQGREDAFERVAEVQAIHTDALMARPGVVGTAVGLGQGARPVLLVLLEYGGVAGIPESLEGVPVRPLVTGKIYALPKPENPGQGKNGGGGGDTSVDPTARFGRPVPIGVSTGHPDITAGTIGCRVTDGANVYALSNNHVYANQNLANIGDNALQPGPYDGGMNPDDAIGTLSDYVEIDFEGGDNVVDAAIALSSEAELGNATPSDGYGKPLSDPISAEIDMRVMKYGRTTGLTKSRIWALNATVNVQYDQEVARFVGQIVIGGGGFSRGGDSGSLVVVEKGQDARRPVGLLFAGGANATIANPIGDVLGAFGVTVDGESQ